MLLIFDCDGVVLSASWEGLYAAYRDFIKALGKDPKSFFRNVPEFKAWWNCDYHVNNQRVGITTREQENLAYRVFYETYNKHSILLPWSQKIFGVLSQGHTLALLTNRHLRVTPELEPVRPFFRYAVGAEDMVALKPSPEGVEKILQESGFGDSRDQAVMFGDRPEDLLAGKAAGVKTAAVIWKWGLGERRHFDGLDPDFIIRRPQDLIKKFSC